MYSYVWMQLKETALSNTHTHTVSHNMSVTADPYKQNQQDSTIFKTPNT